MDIYTIGTAYTFTARRTSIINIRGCRLTQPQCFAYLNLITSINISMISRLINDITPHFRNWITGYVHQFYIIHNSEISLKMQGNILCRFPIYKELLTWHTVACLTLEPCLSHVTPVLHDWLVSPCGGSVIVGKSHPLLCGDSRFRPFSSLCGPYRPNYLDSVSQMQTS